MKSPLLLFKLYLIMAGIIYSSTITKAQIYTFSQQQGTYQPLTTYQSLNPDEVLTSWGDLTLDFNFKFFDRTFRKMMVGQGDLIFIVDRPPFNVGINAINVFFRDLISLNKIVNNSSEVNYSTTGTPGNRIFIVEWKRAGIVEREQIIGFISFQVWLYEKNGDIEFHYGPHFLVDGFSIYAYEEIGIYKWGYDSTFTIKGIGLYGNQNDLQITDKNFSEFPFAVVGIPPDGTIYRFGYDRDLVWNNLSLYGWELINGVSEGSGCIIY